jgi:hypothetical protein
MLLSLDPSAIGTREIAKNLGFSVFFCDNSDHYEKKYLRNREKLLFSCGFASHLNPMKLRLHQ